MAIRTKILLAFAAVLAVTIGVGVFAMQQVAAVDGAAALLRDDYLPSTVSIRPDHGSLPEIPLAWNRSTYWRGLQR